MACNCVLVFAEIVLCVGAFFTLIALATAQWKVFVILSDYYGDVQLSWGLYQACVEVNGVEECDDIEHPQDYLIGCRILLSIAAITVIGAVLLSLVHLCKVSNRTSSKALIIAIIVMCAITVTCEIIAIIVYGANYNEDEKFEEEYLVEDLLEWDLGGSYFINIGAVILLIVACILMWFTHKPQLQVQPQLVVAQPQPIIAQTVFYHPNQPQFYGPGVPAQPYPYATASSGQPVGPPPYTQGQYPPQPHPFAAPATSAFVPPPMDYNAKTTDQGNVG